MEEDIGDIHHSVVIGRNAFLLGLVADISHIFMLVVKVPELHAGGVHGGGDEDSKDVGGFELVFFPLELFGFVSLFVTHTELLLEVIVVLEGLVEVVSDEGNALEEDEEEGSDEEVSSEEVDSNIVESVPESGPGEEGEAPEEHHNE